MSANGHDGARRVTVRRALRVVFVYLLALATCWIGLLVLTAAITDVGEVLRYAFPPIESRVDLPNYTDKERAQQIFWDAKLTIEEYRPFLGWTRLPQETQTVNIGADGFRVHRDGRDAPRDAPSVGIFGGSATWGTGVDDDSTIPALFDQLTRGYRVFNYGQGGWNARQNLALLVNLISEGRMPDVVVFYNGYNHIVNCYFPDMNVHGAYARMRDTLAERPRYGMLYHQIVAPPLRFFQELLRKRKKGGAGGLCSTDPNHAERVAEHLVRIWDMADSLVTARGGRFYAFLQPTVFDGRARTEHLSLRRGDRSDQHAAVYPRIRSLAANRGYFTDLTGAFDVDEYVYIDTAHVTRNGNEIIARRMLQRIESDGLRMAAVDR